MLPEGARKPSLLRSWVVGQPMGVKSTCPPQILSTRGRRWLRRNQPPPVDCAFQYYLSTPARSCSIRRAPSGRGSPSGHLLCEWVSGLRGRSAETRVHLLRRCAAPNTSASCLPKEPRRANERKVNQAARGAQAI